MTPLTPLQCCDHCEYACRAAILIYAGFVMSFLLTYFDSGRDASEIDESTAANGQPVSGVS